MNPMTPAATITSLIAEDHFTQAMDVHEQHLKASAQTGNLTAALDLLVVRNQRERLGDEAAALDVLAALEADVPT